MATEEQSPQFQPRQAHEQCRAKGVRARWAAGAAVLALALAGALIAAASAGAAAGAVGLVEMALARQPL